MMTLAPQGGIRESRRALRQRFNLILVAAGLPIVVLILVLAWQNYRQAHGTSLVELNQAIAARKAGLSELTSSARIHISVMRSFAENRLAEKSNLSAYTGHTDWPGASVNPGTGLGVVLTPPGLMTLSDRQELSAIDPLVSLSRAAHRARPFLQWSYYFSETRSFITIYPWADASAFLAGPNPRETFAGYYDYPLYNLTLPEKNPKREAVWTPVYVDAGGAGLMVTHSAPVYVGDRFMGIVGTDVLLSFISDFLGGFPKIQGNVVLIDQAGNIVASPGETSSSAGKPVQASKILGDIGTIPTTGHFVRRGDDLVAAALIDGTPWKLVITVPATIVRSKALQGLLPHASILVVLTLMFAALALAFRRQFVTPAVALAEFTAAAQEAGADAREPKVPAPFVPLLQAVKTSTARNADWIRHMRAMIDSVPLRVGFADDQSIYRDVNQKMLDFMGRTREEVIGKSIEDVLGKEVGDQFRAFMPRIKAGETIRWEGWVEFPEQGRHYLQRLILPYSADGGPVGVLTFSNDVTSEMEQNAKLAEREAVIRSVVEGALDGIIVMDDKGVTLEFNPAAQQIFGYSAAEAIGRTVGELIVPHHMQTQHTDGMNRYLATGKAHVLGKRVELEGRRKDGSHIPVELTITESLLEGRRIFTSHLRDLTEQKRFEKEMEEGRNRLNQVEKLSAMGSLLAGVAHELNNPLAIVIAQSTMLTEKAPNEDMKRRGERIRAAADRCGRIVKSFLAMARQKPPMREPVNLNQIIIGSSEMVAYGFKSAGIQLDMDLAAELPLIEADSDLMTQVISNLLINAQQALQDRPYPRIVAVSSEGNGSTVKMTIADNGPGVSKEIAERIFDPYFTTKAAGVGTGIGLSMSRNIVAAHGGELSMIETPLGGAAFRIMLPKLVGKDDAIVTQDASNKIETGLNVIVIDDEADVGGSLAEILELFGHRATVVDTAVQALERIRSERFDALFTDLRMPGMDGVTLISEVAEHNPALARNSVIVTGDTVSGPIRMAGLGRDDVIMVEKPFNIEDIKAALHEISERSGRPRTQGH